MHDIEGGPTVKPTGWSQVCRSRVNESSIIGTCDDWSRLSTAAFWVGSMKLYLGPRQLPQ